MVYCICYQCTYPSRVGLAPLFLIVDRKPPAVPEVPKSLSDEYVNKNSFCYNRSGLASRKLKSSRRRSTEMDDVNNLSHTTWNCKYHIVFAPKFRRKVFYQEKRTDIGKILRQLCEWKGVKIIEAEVCPDHIHMLVEIPPKYSVSGVMGYLKGKSSLMIFEKYANLKYKYGNRQFWCRGYYVDTAGKNSKKIAEYIRNQLEEDKALDQVTMKEFVDPFRGSK